MSNASPSAAPSPAHLSAAALTRRLAELAGDERALQVEFLQHLGEFDRREAWAAAGYGSLWNYCRQALHLREGATWRRIAAMRALRRLPVLAAALADGRLCLTTVAILDPVLTEANAEELIARAAFGSKAEVEVLVAELKPRHAPADGVRRLHLPGPPQLAVGGGERSVVAPTVASENTPSPSPAEAALVGERGPSLDVPVPPARPTIQPVAAETFSLRVTIDAALKRDLDRLTELLSHKVPSGDLAAVLREAVASAIEKHGKRRGAVKPSRKVAKPLKTKAAKPDAPPARPRREPLLADLRRQVHERDGGRCTFVGPDGHRCESRWQLEVDHAVAVSHGGETVLANLRLTCRIHNRVHAERALGRRYMARFRGQATSTG